MRSGAIPRVFMPSTTHAGASSPSPEIAPNAAHDALAELERRWPGDFLLVTQNVDDLHERAGSRKLLHMHGALGDARCL